MVIDVQERLAPAMTDPGPVIARCATLVKAATRLDVPILASLHYPKGLGPSVAVLAGDYLFAQSAVLAASTGNMRVVQLFARTLMTIVDGEMRQHGGVERAWPDDDDLGRRER